jgi:hypothetical protein
MKTPQPAMCHAAVSMQKEEVSISIHHVLSDGVFLHTGLSTMHTVSPNKFTCNWSMQCAGCGQHWSHVQVVNELCNVWPVKAKNTGQLRPAQHINQLHAKTTRRHAGTQCHSRNAKATMPGCRPAAALHQLPAYMRPQLPPGFERLLLFATAATWQQARGQLCIVNAALELHVTGLVCSNSQQQNPTA